MSHKSVFYKLALTVLLSCLSASAFVPNALPTIKSVSTLHAKGQAPKYGKKKPKTLLSDEDLAYLETREMTREEMLAVNKQNEDIMNAELVGMTLFSLILSIPMLYLVWVGFFSETASIAEM
jgi:hypothetical protein